MSAVDWNATREQLQEAVAAEKAYFEATYKPLMTEWERRRAAVQADYSKEAAEAFVKWCETDGFDAAEDRLDAFQDRISPLREALLVTPAPDLTAFHWKLQQVFENDGVDVWHTTNANEAVVLLADAARLFGGEA